MLVVFKIECCFQKFSENKTEEKKSKKVKDTQLGINPDSLYKKIFKSL